MASTGAPAPCCTCVFAGAPISRQGNVECSPWRVSGIRWPKCGHTHDGADEPALVPNAVHPGPSDEVGAGSDRRLISHHIGLEVDRLSIRQPHSPACGVNVLCSAGCAGWLWCTHPQPVETRSGDPLHPHQGRSLGVGIGGREHLLHEAKRLRTPCLAKLRQEGPKHFRTCQVFGRRLREGRVGRDGLWVLVLQCSALGALIGESARRQARQRRRENPGAGRKCSVARPTGALAQIEGHGAQGSRESAQSTQAALQPDLRSHR